MVVLAVLFMAGMASAQGGEGGDHCTFQAQVQDNSCDGNCVTSSTFSPACDGDHWFAAQTWCLGLHDNIIYRVTAYLYDTQSGSPMATLQNWYEEGCGGWPNEDRVQLYASHSYYLRVCLEACYGHDCSECTSAGYAMAKVYR